MVLFLLLVCDPGIRGEWDEEEEGQGASPSPLGVVQHGATTWEEIAPKLYEGSGGCGEG